MRKLQEPQVIQHNEYQYEISRIVDKRMIGRSIYYLVQWKGFPVSQSTWEPVIHLQGCQRHIVKFEENRPVNPSKQHTKTFPDYYDDQTILNSRKKKKSEKIKVEEEQQKKNERSRSRDKKRQPKRKQNTKTVKLQRLRDSVENEKKDMDITFQYLQSSSPDPGNNKNEDGSTKTAIIKPAIKKQNTSFKPQESPKKSKKKREAQESQKLRPEIILRNFSQSRKSEKIIKDLDNHINQMLADKRPQYQTEIIKGLSETIKKVAIEREKQMSFLIDDKDQVIIASGQQAKIEFEIIKQSSDKKKMERKSQVQKT